MKKSLWPIIRKLLTAINMHSIIIFTVSREMIYSAEYSKTSTLLRLNSVTPIAIWYAQHPEVKPRKKETRKYVRENVCSSFKEANIVKALVKIWDAVKDGEDNGAEKEKMHE